MQVHRYINVYQTIKFLVEMLMASRKTYFYNTHFIEYCYLLPIDSGGVECDFASTRVNTFHLQSKCAFEKNGHMIHKHHLYQRCKDICDLYIR